MSANKPIFVIHRIEFDRDGRGIRDISGFTFDGGHASSFGSLEAAVQDASATARLIPGATFGVFQLVAYAEEPKR